MKFILSMLFVTTFVFSQEYKYIKKYEIDEKDLFPEGITYSSSTKSFYLGSLHKNKIIKVDAITGKYEDFIPSNYIKGYYLGLMVDDQKKVIWSCGKDHMTKNPFIAKFSLVDGNMIKRYDYDSKNIEMLFNDLVLDRNGDIYFTNSSDNEIFKIDNKRDKIELFYKNDNIKYPNGITISDDGKFIYVASGRYGIKIINKNNSKLVEVDNDEFDSSGIDGLKFYRNSIIGIQNYVRSKEERNIRRFYLNNNLFKVSKMEILDKNNKFFDVPTTFVIVKNKLYCLANSQLLYLKDNNNSIKEGSKLNNIYILEYDLK